MRLSDIMIIALILVSGSMVYAQTTDANNLSFPYIAEITGDNVYVRSGPGTQYYYCEKLNSGDRVKVVAAKNGWARITPPIDCYSWVSQRYVHVDPNVSGIGIVTAEKVIVRAGSVDGNPLHSETEQSQLHRGEKVSIIGAYGSDYYKIVPPEGVYLWVSQQFTRYLGNVGQVAMLTRPETAPIPEIVIPAVTEMDTASPNASIAIQNSTEPDSADSNSAKTFVSVVPAVISTESKRLEEYYELEKKVTAEKTKDFSKQNYSQLKKGFEKIAGDSSAGKAARYANFALEQIERYELVLSVVNDNKLQSQQFAQIRDNIDKARAAKLSELKLLGKYAVLGQFKISNIYGQGANRRYQIVDEAGKVICFALPKGEAVNMNMDEFVGKTVGLVGNISAHSATSGAIVEFTEVVVLK